MVMKRIAGLVLAAVAVTACGQVQPTPTPAQAQETPSPSASPSAVAAQRHVCGEFRGESCEAVIARVIEQVPGMAASPVAVADVRDEGATTQRGGDFVALVSFQPLGAEDVWMKPPTWVVTRPMFSSEMSVEPWRAGSLPAHFVTLLRSAGLGA